MRNTNWYHVLFAMLIVQGAVAQIPQTMSYQGRLTDVGGNPVANGNYSLTFRLYDVSGGGVALWEETQASVPVSGGIFSVILGSVMSFDTLSFSRQYWLAVSVSGGAELSPRTTLTSSPYSISASRVSGGSNIFPASGNVGIGTTSPAQRLDVHSTDAYCMTRVVSNDGSKGQMTAYNGGQLLLNSYTTGGFSPGSILICPGDVIDSRSVLITSTGNVGIGTTSPAQKLDVRDGSGTGGQGGAIHVGGIVANGDPKLIYFGDGSFVTIGENTADDRMELTASAFLFNNGSLGIGVIPSGYKLQVAGSTANTTGVWTNYSDRRLKTDIRPIENALSTVDQLQGVTFRWKDAKKNNEYGRVRGLIAQDVEKVIPEWVKTGSDGYKSLEPIGDYALLIEAVKELNIKNKELSTRNEKLEARLSELEAVVKSLASTKVPGANKTVGELR